MGMLARLQHSATAAHVLPLAVFMLMSAVPDVLRIENSELPWFQRAPEHWLYPLQTLIVGALLIFFRKHYQLAPWRGGGLAVLFAVVGIGCWILPAWLWQQSGSPEAVPAWQTWLGWGPRQKGFDPEVLDAWPVWQGVALMMRLVRLVIVVPLVEELFWRGYLMRSLVADDRPWMQVPFGMHAWKSFGIVTALVVLVHAPEDRLAAAIWGTLMYVLAVRRRSLGACVLMHAVGNLLLGLYVLKTRQWGFW